MSRFSRRRWGWYLTIWDDRRFKVKLLRFYGMSECSRQRHQSRGELWLFLRGAGRFQMGEELTPVFAGDYKFVAPRSWHQFHSEMGTWVLEVQYGKKCDEGDIERV